MDRSDGVHGLLFGLYGDEVFLKIVKERLSRSVGDVGACEGCVLFITGPFFCRSSDFKMQECSGDTAGFVGEQGLVEVVVVLESTEEALGFGCSSIEQFGRCADKFGSGRHVWRGGSSFGWGRRRLLSLGWGNSCYWSLPFGSGRGLLRWRWYGCYWVWGVE
jgi:hypothetical protein